MESDTSTGNAAGRNRKYSVAHYYLLSTSGMIFSTVINLLTNFLSRGSPAGNNRPPDTFPREDKRPSIIPRARRTRGDSGIDARAGYRGCTEIKSTELFLYVLIII